MTGLVNIAFPFVAGAAALTTSYFLGRDTAVTDATVAGTVVLGVAILLRLAIQSSYARVVKDDPVLDGDRPDAGGIPEQAKLYKDHSQTIITGIGVVLGLIAFSNDNAAVPAVEAHRVAAVSLLVAVVLALQLHGLLSGFFPSRRGGHIYLAVLFHVTTWSLIYGIGLIAASTAFSTV